MTQPDETTMPDRPEKAHGDALEEVVEDHPNEGSDHPVADDQD